MVRIHAVRVRCGMDARGFPVDKLIQDTTQTRNQQQRFVNSKRRSAESKDVAQVSAGRGVPAR